MRRLGHFIVVRHGENWKLLFRFGLAGGSGVLVNLPFAAFDVRWYHLFSFISVLTANLWNFELDRRWTFRSANHRAWWREYLPFLVVGLGHGLSV